MRDQLVEGDRLHGKFSRGAYPTHVTIRSRIEREGAGPIRNGDGPNGGVSHPVERQVLPEIVQIPGGRLERKNPPGISHELGGEERVEADVRANIENDVSWLYRRFEDLPFVPLITAEPVAVHARAHDPTVTAQRTLNDWHSGLLGQ